MTRLKTSKPKRVPVAAKIHLPKRCPRHMDDCQPLAQMAGAEDDFFCCGMNNGKRRRYAQDRFRFCCKTRGYDSLSDMDERDISTEIAVLSMGLSIGLNMDLNDAGRYIPLPRERKRGLNLGH